MRRGVGGVQNLAEKKFLRQSFDYLTDKYNLLSDHIDKKRLRQDLMTQKMEREEEMVERKLLETANRKEIAERRALLKEHEKITRYYMHQHEPLTYTLIQIERALERAQIDLTFKKLHPAPQLFTHRVGKVPKTLYSNLPMLQECIFRSVWLLQKATLSADQPTDQPEELPVYVTLAHTTLSYDDDQQTRYPALYICFNLSEQATSTIENNYPGYGKLLPDRPKPPQHLHRIVQALIEELYGYVHLPQAGEVAPGTAPTKAKAKALLEIVVPLDIRAVRPKEEDADRIALIQAQEEMAEETTSTLERDLAKRNQPPPTPAQLAQKKRHEAAMLAVLEKSFAHGISIKPVTVAINIAKVYHAGQTPRRRSTVLFSSS